MHDVTRDWKIWNAIRDLNRESLLIHLARTLGEVSPEALEEFIDGPNRGRRAGDEDVPPRTLTEAVEAFCRAARSRCYYQELWLQGQPSSLNSPKTEDFGARLTLLFDLCMDHAETGEPREACEAFEKLFDLLREIDRFERDDIVFWADEPGTWQLGLEWSQILPPYLACLRRIVGPEELEARARASVGELIRNEMTLSRSLSAVEVG